MSLIHIFGPKQRDPVRSPRVPNLTFQTFKHFLYTFFTCSLTLVNTKRFYVSYYTSCQCSSWRREKREEKKKKEKKKIVKCCWDLRIHHLEMRRICVHFTPSSLLLPSQNPSPRLPGPLEFPICPRRHPATTHLNPTLLQQSSPDRTSTPPNNPSSSTNPTKKTPLTPSTSGS